MTLVVQVWLVWALIFGIGGSLVAFTATIRWRDVLTPELKNAIVTVCAIAGFLWPFIIAFSVLWLVIYLIARTYIRLLSKIVKPVDRYGRESQNIKL